MSGEQKKACQNLLSSLYSITLKEIDRGLRINRLVRANGGEIDFEERNNRSRFEQSESLGSSSFYLERLVFTPEPYIDWALKHDEKDKSFEMILQD